MKATATISSPEPLRFWSSETERSAMTLDVIKNRNQKILSLQCRRILASERMLINRAPSWIQTRKRLGEWELEWKENHPLFRNQYGDKFQDGGEFTIASSKTPSLQARKSWSQFYCAFNWFQFLNMRRATCDQADDRVLANLLISPRGQLKRSGGGGPPF